MHRRLQEFLPVVLIALAMQVLTPIAACWEAAIEAASPLQNTVICHDNGASGVGQSDQRVPAAHAASCSICCLARASVALDAPQATLLVPLRHAEHAVWHDTVTSITSSRAGSNSQARAPPQLT
jgi:hypothetical protein